ncbi:MAG: Maf family protein [Bacillota bacterium]|nr:Maf family protein [Bacillota bacterium]
MKDYRLVVALPQAGQKVLDKIKIKFETTDIIVEDIDTLNSEDVAAQRVKKILSETGGENTIAVATETVLMLNGKVFDAPNNAEEAKKMIDELSGKTHSFVTWLCVGGAGCDPETVRVETKVYLKGMTEEEKRLYMDMEDYNYPGAYSPAGKGSLLVKKIEGDFNNIFGMPVSTLYDILKEKYNIIL